jgi:hypothetical protein
MWHVWGRRMILVGNLKEDNHLEDLGINGRIILKGILGTEDGRT